MLNSTLGEIDLLILRAIKDDNRVAMTDLAIELGASKDDMHKRLKIMVEQGLVKTYRRGKLKNLTLRGYAAIED